jgi:Tfp pilus assembly protein PilV
MGADRRGFVLPTTLMVMTLLTVMLTAAFTLVSAEYRTTDNSHDRSRAHALAEAGLHNYFASNPSLGGSQDSVRYTMTNGYVDVIARRLRDSTSSKKQVWLVRATAYSSDPYQSGQLQGTRTVARLATYNPATMPATGALYAPNGVYVDGSNVLPNPISGTDAACNSPQGSFGLVVPTGGYVEAATGGPDPTGTPASNGVSNRPSAASVLAQTRIDWASLTAGNFTPDYTLPAGPVVWTGTPVVLIQGDYTLSGTTPGMPANPTGVLVVTGNLTLGPDFHWEGVLLVGGYLSARNDGTRLHGITMTGLNIALGNVVPRDTIRRNNNMHVWWSSCDLNSSVQSLGGLIPVGNAWVNTWSTY